jgi:hypothetical protein
LGLILNVTFVSSSLIDRAVTAAARPGRDLWP